MFSCTLFTFSRGLPFTDTSGGEYRLGGSTTRHPLAYVMGPLRNVIVDPNLSRWVFGDILRGQSSCGSFPRERKLRIIGRVRRREPPFHQKDSPEKGIGKRITSFEDPPSCIAVAEGTELTDKQVRSSFARWSRTLLTAVGAGWSEKGFATENAYAIVHESTAYVFVFLFRTKLFPVLQISAELFSHCIQLCKREDIVVFLFF